MPVLYSVGMGWACQQSLGCILILLASTSVSAHEPWPLLLPQLAQTIGNECLAELAFETENGNMPTSAPL